MVKIIETADKLAEGIHRLREDASKVEEELKHAAAKSKLKAEEAWEEARHYIKKHPGKVVATALALGAMVGAVVARRQKK
jgi:ElaB/YqjD/DUF883 family membrane-anchored ribosome-binding protein